MLRRMSSGVESLSRGTRPKRQVSAPYFWDFGVYDRVFGTAQVDGDDVGMNPSQVSNDQNSLASAQENSTVSPTSVKKAAWQSTLKDEDVVPYTISFGETFESIALKHDMTAVELRRANPGVPFSTRPVPGQTLRVKKQSQTSESIENEESKRVVLDTHHHRTAEEQQKHEGVERQVQLYIGPDKQVAGRLIVGITSGFILFEPFETSQDVSVETTENVKMLFALDRRDILGCAAVSRISARIKAEEDEEPSMLLQLVWKNPDLGFSTEQQTFFEVSNEDTAVLVDAVYAWDLGDNHEKPSGGKKSGGRSLTSGVAALRILEEHAKAMNMEDFIKGNSGSSDFDNKSDDVEVVYEVAMIPRESTLLSREQAASLANALPQRLRAGCWEMVYDFVDHGVSLHALLTAAKQHPETLLLVQDLDSRDVIGVFAVCAWDPANNNGFFGTGETFVFRFQGDSINLEKFEWSGTNEFFQTCSDHHIAVGGGGNFALCLDADLLHCTSGNCKTFKGLETRPLSSSPSFRINGIELWAVKAIHKGRSSTLGSLNDDKLRSPRVLKSKLSEDRSTNNSGVVDLSSLKSFNKRRGSDDALSDEYVKL